MRTTANSCKFVGICVGPCGSMCCLCGICCGRVPLSCSSGPLVKNTRHNLIQGMTLANPHGLNPSVLFMGHRSFYGPSYTLASGSCLHGSNRGSCLHDLSLSTLFREHCNTYRLVSWAGWLRVFMARSGVPSTPTAGGGMGGGSGRSGGEKSRAAEGIVTQPVPNYRAADPGERYQIREKLGKY